MSLSSWTSRGRPGKSSSIVIDVIRGASCWKRRRYLISASGSIEIEAVVRFDTSVRSSLHVLARASLSDSCGMSFSS